MNYNSHQVYMTPKENLVTANEELTTLLSNTTVLARV